MIDLIILFMLALLNGVLAMSELAVMSSRKARLQQAVEEGLPGAESALNLANDPNRFLSTVQIGISLIGVLAGAFGGAALGDDAANLLARISPLEPYAESLGFALVVIFTTYLSLVFGELVPKRLAIQNPERVSRLIARPMRFLSRLTAPLVWVLSVSTEGVLRVLGVRASDEPSVSEEEIKMMMREGARSGIFDTDEQEMIAGVFRLDDIRVNGLMTPRTEMAWLDVDDSFEEIQRKITDNQHSRYPVVDGDADHVIGIIKARDLLHSSLDGSPPNLREHLSPVFYIPESATAADALQRFRQREKQMAMVIGEHGGVEGLITVTDILEAIVGDLETPEAIQREDGSWLIDGLMPVPEFKAVIDIHEDLPGETEGIYQTIAGFFIHHYGDIPHPADRFVWSSYSFEVMDMDGRRIDKILVRVEESDGDGVE